MTPRQRLMTVLRGEIPDRVPVAPDFSNMIPARRTGKPFWDLYLYNDPPIWEAYIDCAKYFGIDSVMDGYFPLDVEPADLSKAQCEEMIIKRTEDRIITQSTWMEDGKRQWSPTVNVYYRADPPTCHVKPEKIGLPPVPQQWEPIEGRKSTDISPEGLKRVKKLMGDQGLVGVWLTSTCMIKTEEDLYDYYDDPDLFHAKAEEEMDKMEKRFNTILSLEEKPDFLCVGGSGSLILQTEKMLRELTFPTVKRAIELATSAGIPTHVHCCGPETKLIKMMAEETSLTVIDPLEIPPMGDCSLAELKQKYGKNMTLKGNLHTTNVMLRGTKQDVLDASRQAIEDAAEGGRFILSTGDQCGRDTPDENIFAMIEAAETWGRY